MSRNAQTVAQWEALEIKMSVFGAAVLLRNQFFSSWENKDLPLTATGCDDQLGK